MEINPPIDIKQIKIMPKNSDKEKKMTWPIFGGLELFYDNKPVFESLIQKSKYKDPHRCGVYIDATYYSTNLFYNLQEKFPKGLYVTTFDVENSWFMQWLMDINCKRWKITLCEVIKLK